MVAEKKTVCVSFGQRNKIVSPGSEVGNLRETVLAAFPDLPSNSRIILQLFDKDFEECMLR